MNKKSTISILLLLILFATSCEPKQDSLEKINSILSEDPIARSDTNSVAEIDNNPIDSVLIKRLEEKYRGNKLLTNYDDSLHLPEREGDYSVVILKLNFTKDDIEDYLVVEYGLRSANGYIVDGSTGRRIETGSYPDPRPMFWNRAVNLDFEVVNVNCGDGHQELLLKYYWGLDLGSYYELLIYRYDQDSMMVELIFQKTIAEDYQITDQRPITNYIDILYSSVECFNEIKVQEGQRPKSANAWEHSAIKPKKNSVVSTYVFNEAKNMFELKK